MSTVIYSYSTNSFARSTLLHFNPINGQLEPSPLNIKYPKQCKTSSYRIPESTSSLKKWGTLTNLSTPDLPTIVEETSDSGLGSSSDCSDSESSPSPAPSSSITHCEINNDSDSSEDSTNSQKDLQWPSSISYLARFRPQYLRDYQLSPQVDHDLLYKFNFFNLTRSIDAPKEWSQEEMDHFIQIPMPNQKK